ncbi:MAG: hypothetical protein WCM76_15425 [Bacteroidota bacterium]
MKQRIAAIIKFFLKVIIIVFVTLILFECSYRWYVIDFYSFSWKGLNSPENRSKENVDLLVFGDSFSANDHGYVSCLQKLCPGKVIVNASSAGIGIKQVNLFASKRIKQANPKAILYQVYVGNDLIDVQNLSNWKSISIVRNLYWKITNQFMSISYLNQRMGALRKHETTKSLHLDEHFSKELYDKRTTLFIKADTESIEKSVTLKDDFLKRYLVWKDELEVLLEKIPLTTKVYIAFIPHCAQINDFYIKNMTELGATFSDNNNFSKTDYAFFEYARNDFKGNTNVVFLNPLTFFKETDTANYRLYYENDPHFNEHGNSEFARYLKPLIFNE